MATAQTARTEYVLAGNGTTFAFRRIGLLSGDTTSTPLLMHIHFRANMDFWDPLLVNTLAQSRQVIIFDQSGVGRSDGDVPTTYQGWADDVIALVRALKFEKIDLLGFSMGGYAVQMVALTAPHLIRNLIIAGSGPSEPSERVAGIIWPRERAPSEHIRALASVAADVPEEVERAIAFSFFPDTHEGRAASQAYFARVSSRSIDTPMLSLLGWEGSRKQRLAAQEWHVPNRRNSFHRLGELRMPVLVLNGDEDLLIPTSWSWELLRDVADAKLIVYPRSGHGFIWQYSERVAHDIDIFLSHDAKGGAVPKL